MSADSPTPQHRLDLAIMEPIEIEIGARDGGYDVYLTRVEDVRGQLLTIAAPMQKGDMVPLGRGEWVQVRVKRKDAMFSARAEVRDVRWNPFAAIDLELGGNWKRQQRRSDVRLEVRIEPILVEAILPGNTRLKMPFSIRNLSVGGALLVSRRVSHQSPQGQQLATNMARVKAALPQAELELQFQLGDFPLICFASIVRAEEVADGHEQFYRLAVSFAELSPRQEDAIFRFIFAQQRELRQRGVA